MNEKINIDEKFKKNNFQVPENYFEQFSSKISERIVALESSEKNKKSKFSYRSQLKLAASILIFISLSFAGYKFFFNENPQVLNNIQISELIENDYVNIDDEYLLYELLSEENVDLQLNSIEDQDVISYLEDESIDESILLNE
ncbi:MAG TPA: hypothetical protein DDX39_06230 [Bacteroidales bacterium]|nr:MAG: hypothetical protein A2W98_00595 [Bacteroidetes bacterium GWF2_33_38]OFY86271.1 MAG: hypothetical protein A2236_12940 [Bacteroidetes bacterium RIFOXYA2_FULL_33_7]HBF88223.1 hypothetical protein [Bacteroidales bacterium]